MSKKTTRVLTIGRDRYVWRFTATALEADGTYQGRAHSTLIVYAATRKQGALMVEFTTWDDRYRGNPLMTGWPTLDRGANEVVLNLNKPQFAREIILYGLAHGWDPQTGQAPFRITNGVALLAELGYNVDALYPK